MAIFKATFFFVQHKAGWTETFYSSKDSHAAVLADVQHVVPFRVGLLGSNTALEYVRVSDDAIQGDVDTFVPPLADQKNTFVNAGSSDFQNTGMVVRLHASPIGNRSLTMRGIPDGIVDDGGKLAMTGNFLLRFNSWTTAIINRFGIKRKDPANPRLTINSILWNQPTQRAEIGFNVPHGMVTGDFVQLGGELPAADLRGIHRVVAVGANSVFVKAPFLVLGNLGFAWGRKVSYIVSNIIKATPLRVSSRKAGRPFGVPVGRR